MSFPGRLLRSIKEVSEVSARRCYHNAEIDSILRSTQATEIFRASFLDAAKSHIRITTTDLDELIIAQKCRPSALIGVFSLAGSIMGTAARFLPSPYHNTVQQLINDVAMQQLNNNIRDLQAEESYQADLKETIKYHRDIELAEVTVKSADASNPENEGNVNYKNTIVSAALGNVLKLSRCV
jgi:demethoxyubiquinone hydroxylase (CLK1/Coq7/Cat5 family)